MIHRIGFIELHPVRRLREKDQVAFVTIIHAVTERCVLHSFNQFYPGCSKYNFKYNHCFLLYNSEAFTN